MAWNIGDRVVQTTYGPGTVLEVNDQHTTIHFDNGGRRRFATHLVVLEAVGAASLPKMSRGSGQTSEGTIAVGYKNPNRQVVLRQTNGSGNVPGQRLYVLMCGDCGREYGANGCDVHLRKCPGCMGGPLGLDY